jgi:hypothetical protein
LARLARTTFILKRVLMSFIIVLCGRIPIKASYGAIPVPTADWRLRCILYNWK